MGKSAGTTFPLAGDGKGWLWSVRIAAMVGPLLGWATILPPFSRLMQGPCATPWPPEFSLRPIEGVYVTLPYLFILLRLLTGPDKRGLAFAVVTSSAALVVYGLTLLALWSQPRIVREQKGEMVFLGLVVFSQVCVLLAAIKTYYSMQREVGDLRKLGLAVVQLAVYVLFVGIIAAIVISITPVKMGPGAVFSLPSAAVSSLRTINTAEATYYSAYGDSYSSSLSALGPAAGNSPPTPSAAGLIDAALASGKKYIYTITYKPGPPDARGKITTYTVTARPVEECRYEYVVSFFTDQSGVIRETHKNREATVADPPFTVKLI